jgi:hypothetical protein
VSSETLTLPGSVFHVSTGSTMMTISTSDVIGGTPPSLARTVSW